MSLLSPVTDANTPLFSTELISPEVLSVLPEGYQCRPIQRSDYHKGFLDVLRVLTTVGDVTEQVGFPGPVSPTSVHSFLLLPPNCPPAVHPPILSSFPFFSTLIVFAVWLR